LIFCLFGRLRYGIDPGVGAQRAGRTPGQSLLLTFCWAGTPAFEKVSRCKSETASGSTRNNGYAPNPKNQKAPPKRGF
jgi:hypothetical protein